MLHSRVSTLLAVLVSLSACAPGVAVGVANLDVPESLVLAQAPLNDTWTEVPLTLHNHGAAELTVTGQVTLGPFRVLGGAVVVPALGDASFLVGYRPTGYGEVPGQVRIVDARNNEWFVALEGRAEPDLDGDGHIAAAAGGGDCDDDDAAVNPDATERCNGVDDDCDGRVDDDAADADTWLLDADGDGYGGLVTKQACTQPDRYTMLGGDCDDTRATVNPGAIDAPYDGVDQDCGDDPDDDVDGDGFGHLALGGTDCDDNDATIHPGAVEVPYDGVDQDCSGGSDYDADRDGFVADRFGGPDCDDDSADTNPDASERDDGLDNDCDGFVDEDFVASGDLLITEVLLLAKSGGAAESRFVEIANTSSREIAVAGGTVAWASQVSDISSLGTIDPGATVVLCTNASLADWPCDGAIKAGSSAAAVIEVSLDVLLDSVDTRDWAHQPATSWELDGDQLDPGDNDPISAWCPSQSALGSGSWGSPGTLTGHCDAP